MSIRIDILKYLSDTYDLKPMNDFLKWKNKEYSLLEISAVLKEMYNPSFYVNLQGTRVIEIDGNQNWLVLGTKYNKLGNLLEYSPSYNPDLDVEHTLDNTIFSARILELGRKELEEYELRESIKKVNDSVLKTNKRTILVASLAALFSLISLIKDFGKSDKHRAQELQNISKELNKQSQMLQVLLKNQDQKNVDLKKADTALKRK